MRALIDTHAFIWWFAGDKRLSVMARDIISDPSNSIIVSAAVAWEIAIKESIGKLALPDSAPLYVRSRTVSQGFEELHISTDHALHTRSLPLHHRDPFDRILVAQSQLEGVPIITSDPLISQYGVSIVW